MVNSTITVCPYCLGTGKLKAMQRAMISHTESIRIKDKEVKCKHCDGIGVKIIS